MMDEERFNPFTEAIQNVGSGLRGLMRSTPPPPRIQEAVDLYNQRLRDPDIYELRAIYELHGPEGAMEYVKDIENKRKAWGL